jgi:two-component system, cell cycle response regulator
VGLPARRQTWLRVGGGLVLAVFAAFVAHLGLGLGGSGLDWLFDDFVYNGLMLSAAVACLLRAALVRRERLPWLVVGIGLLSWVGGEIYWTAKLADLTSPPTPSIADALYLGFYPASYVALVLLLRSRTPHLPRSVWLDGAIAALAVGTVASGLAFQPILDASSGTAAEVATNLAYPLGDLLLVSLAVAVFGLSGWRPGRAWILIGAGLALMAVADGVYLFKTATGEYIEGTLVDAMWPASALLVGLAAWQRPKAGRTPRIEGLRVILVPAICAVIALGMLTYDHYHRVNHVTLVLAVATLLLVTLRMALAFAENQRVLASSRHEALTDALTDLRNRRGLMADLEEERLAAPEDGPLGVMMFDLDGFKQYNDSFGHHAGDALLARLGVRLGQAIGPYGCAYRLGGDEFCALVRPSTLGLVPIADLATAALTEEGEGFEVSTSYGTATVPADAPEAEEALRVADRRMYAQKGGRSTSVTRQTRDVLLRALREREPQLHRHVHDVADLALGVGRALGMSSEQLDELGRAAELHDVGKVAIPDAILSKADSLDEAEWDFMERHTEIGERILSAAPALLPVARIVRSSHERWDGQGYPDGLRAEEIPLGSRIVAVCDAYNAMVSNRPYRPSMDHEPAMAEIERCAGAQFDPRVVEAFGRVMAETAPPATADAARS